MDHIFTMIKALAHVCVLSSNLDRTLDFYCGVLGLKKKFDFIRNDQRFGFYLQVDDLQFIEVFEDKSGFQEEIKKKSITHFCLEVEDIQAMRAALIANHVTVSNPVKGSDRSWQIWCKDPDGVDIEFHQYTEESSQLTGVKCVVNW